MSVDEAIAFFKKDKKRAVAIVVIALLILALIIYGIYRLFKLIHVKQATDEQMFAAVTNTIIDNLEGGYANPQTMNLGPQYSTSGETMFGIDRLNGGSINTSDAGVQFWNLIDNTRDTSWVWNYKGGAIAGQLKDLTLQMMEPEYQSLAARYLDTAAIDLVHSDNGLLLHFIYATWNGPGWFKKFADAINDAVSNGTTDIGQLRQIALDSRTQSGNILISQEGPKITPLIMTA
jgi:hypothetical protein